MTDTKTSSRLAPIVAKAKKHITELATAGGRKRPIVAINEEGKLVVCCRRTAVKNGWEIQQVLYERAKPVVEEAPKPATKRAAKKTTVLVEKADIQKVKDAVDTSLGELLGE